MLDFFRKSIFWILLLALALRLWGIEYGFPFFLINDETPHVYGALKMIELKTLVPAFHQEEFKSVLYYPPLLSYFFLIVLSPVIAVHYLLSGFPPLGEYKALLAFDPSFIWIAARFWMALIGVADIFVVYILARRMFASERAAIFSALFLSLSFWHLQLSHNVRHWLPAAFMISILWYFAVKIAEGRISLKGYAVSGIIAGLATGGINTAAVVGLIPLAAARFFHKNTSGLARKIFSREMALLFLSFLAVALLFVGLYPYGLTRAEGAPGASADVAGRFSALAGKNIAGWLLFLGAYAKTLWNFETPLFLTAFLGLILAWREEKRFWVLTACFFAVAFFSLLYFFDDFTSRGVIFVLPILAAFAGYAADRVLSLIQSLIPPTRRIVFLFSIFYFLFLFGWQAIIAVRYDWLLSRKDTRLVARDWVFETIPAGSGIIMDAQYFRLPNTLEGVRKIKELDPSALRAADLALLRLPADFYPKPSYQVLNLNFISPNIRADSSFGGDNIRKSGLSHLIVEYADQDGIKDDVKRIMAGSTLIKRFSPWKGPNSESYVGSGKINDISIAKLFDLERFGLFVDIYEL